MTNHSHFDALRYYARNSHFGNWQSWQNIVESLIDKRINIFLLNLVLNTINEKPFKTPIKFEWTTKWRCYHKYTKTHIHTHTTEKPSKHCFDAFFQNENLIRNVSRCWLSVNSLEQRHRVSHQHYILFIQPKIENKVDEIACFSIVWSGLTEHSFCFVSLVHFVKQLNAVAGYKWI